MIDELVMKVEGDISYKYQKCNL